MSDAPRRPIVLREGPSKRKPLVVDGIAGGIGLLLLVGSVVLVGVLPEEEVLDPQYKVTFSTTPYAAAAEGWQSKVVPFLAEGDTVTWQEEVIDENVATISFGLFLREDMPATLPDVFTFEVEAPNGTIYRLEADGSQITTLPVGPSTEDAVSRAPNFWVQAYDGTGVKNIRFGLTIVPDDYIFTTEPGFELFEVREALREKHRTTDAIGTWEVRLTLVDAGDCPELDPTSSMFQRAQECRMQNAANNGDAEDPALDLGNPVTLSAFEYTWYSLAVEEQ